MEKFPVLQNEPARLNKLYSYNILDLESEDRLDDLTKLTASILDVPICLITLMDADRQTFISKVGTDTKGNQRKLAFCKYTVVQEDILEVQDTTQDERFSQNSLVISSPNIRYYIGSPLIDEEGFIIGTVCGYDLKPRQMNEAQKIALKQITSTVMQLIKLRKVDLEQIAYKSELDRTVKMKDRFLSDISHEIRTPLTSIIGFTELLTSSELSKGQRSHAETVKIAAKRLTEVVNEVFDTYKIAPHENTSDNDSRNKLSAQLPVSNKISPLVIPSLNGLKILLAEDNKHLQILCRTFIERNEGEIHIVSNGQEAIDYLAKHEIDVVLLDMQMPVKNGIQVAKHIRNELNLDCSVIGCSANLLNVDYTTDDFKFLDEFITKPYTEFRLISEILQQFESKVSNSIKDDFRAILNELCTLEGEELVHEFEEIFKNRIPQDIDDLIRARKNRNFQEIKNRARYLSTTLLTLNFEHGLSLARELEKAANNDQDVHILMLTDRFIDYLNTALKEI